MKPNISQGPAVVANQLAAMLFKPALTPEAEQRLRRAKFIAQNGLSAREAEHISLDFDPAKEAGSR